MSAPVIDPESSILSYPQWLTWEHQFSATNTPTSWAITSGAFPSGMTFQAGYAVIGSASTDQINLTAHGFANGTLLVFGTLTGGAGLSTATPYYVVNQATDTFKLAASLGGPAIDITTNATAATVFRPGYVSGFATIPGISTVRLTASNGYGPSAEVLWTIGIEAAAAAPDSNADVVWDMATNNIIVQTSSVLNLTPADRTTPILFVKEQDDLFIRLRIVKNGSILPLEMVNLKLILKELEPENQIVVGGGTSPTAHCSQLGTGDGTNYLIYAKFNGNALASSLSNYEADTGTFYGALAELELTFKSPESIGPENLVRSSKTFTIQIERDLGETA